MARRTLVSVSAFAALTAALALVATVPAAGQAPSTAKTNGAATRAYTPPKTPDGQPDLSGYWTNSTSYAAGAAEGRHEGVLHAAGPGGVSRRGATGRRTGDRLGARRALRQRAVRARKRPDHAREEPADIAHRGSPGRQDTAPDPRGREEECRNRRGQEAQGRPVRHREEHELRQSLHHHDGQRASDVGSGVSGELPDHPVAGLRDDSRRAASRGTRHPPGWPPVSPVESAFVDWVLAGPLGGQYARGRNTKLERQESRRRPWGPTDPSMGRPRTCG